MCQTKILGKCFALFSTVFNFCITRTYSHPEFPAVCLTQAATDRPKRGTFAAAKFACVIYEPVIKDFERLFTALPGRTLVLCVIDTSVPVKMLVFDGWDFPQDVQQSIKHDSWVQVVRETLFTDELQYFISLFCRPHVDEVFTGLKFDNLVTGGYNPCRTARVSWLKDEQITATIRATGALNKPKMAEVLLKNNIVVQQV